MAALSFPDPVGVVNDFANILSPSTEQQITDIIHEVEATNSAEVAVVTIDSLDGNDVNDYAVQMGRSWGIGHKDRDDGVLFLTAVAEHKTYIATGYGVEGYITDSQAFRITDQVVVPFFKQGDYDGGILAGVREIKKALVDLEKLPGGDQSSSIDFSAGDIFFFLIFFISFIFPWTAAVFARSKRWWPGGVVGAVIGALLALIFSVTFFIILPLSIFGFIFDYIASKNYKKGKSHWWTGGGSSGWGGGSSFGSSSGGSSFGGFSGGSFGGGGGGSSW